MLEIRLPAVLSREFLELIPEQRAHVDELMQEGIILSYSLALDRSLLWVTLRARGPEEVRRIFDSFPMRRFMTPDIYPLAFHHHVSLGLPQPSLN